MKSFLTVSFVFLILFSSNLFAKNAMIQTINGSYAFPIDEDQAMIRVTVHPNDLNIKGDIAKTLNQFTVITCVEGRCEFSKPNTGLGFFEAKFPAPKLTKARTFNTLVVACSRLGCVKRSLDTRVVYPQDKF